MRRPGTHIMVLILVMISGCTPPSQPPEPARYDWHQLAGPDPRAIIHDVKACEGTWFASGAVQIGEDPSTAPNEQQASSYRPALWRWNGGRWSELPTVPLSYYGERAILRSFACKDGRLAAVGAASGGAHGNPRITTWLGPLEGPLAQNPDPYFEMFGGNDAVGVGDITSFGKGFAITGNFLNSQGLPSATVWLSADGMTWERFSNLAELSSTAQSARRAVSITEVGNELFLVGEERVGLRITPLVLSSQDGKAWQRIAVPGEGSAQWTDKTRTVVLRNNEVVYLSGDSSRSFTLDTGQSTQPAAVTSVTKAGSVTLVGACGGKSCGAWSHSGEALQWRAVAMPVTVKSTPNSAVLMAASGNKVVMALTEGKTVQLFEAVVA